jgi:hypothetical protein
MTVQSRLVGAATKKKGLEKLGLRMVDMRSQRAESLPTLVALDLKLVA